MSTMPRTPRYFPCMKVRGARRRRLAPLHRLQRQADFVAVAIQTIRGAFEGCARMLAEIPSWARGDPVSGNDPDWEG